MRPASSSVVLRQDLTAVANEYDEKEAAGLFIGLKAAPIFKSDECEASYPVFLRSNFKKKTRTERGKDGSYNRITGEYGSGSFKCEDRGLVYPIDDARRRRYAKFIDAEASAARILRFQMLLARELRVYELYSAAGFTNHNVAAAWSDVTNGKPLTDIRTGIRAVRNKCGMPKSRISLIIPEADFDEMLDCTQVANKSLYTFPGIQPADLSAAQIATMLGIKEVLVAASCYDTKEEGVAESESAIWAAGVMWIAVLCNENADLEQMSAARTIIWTEDAPELPVVESWRDEDVRADMLRMRENTDEVLTGEKDLLVYQITNT